MIGQKPKEKKKYSTAQQAVAAGIFGAGLGGTILKPAGGSMRSRLIGAGLVGGVGAVVGGTNNV